MKVSATAFILIVATATRAVSAPLHRTHFKEISNTEKKNYAPTTDDAPPIVEELERSTTCSDGFKQEGKTCVKRVVAPPNMFCPSGFFRTSDRETECAKYFEKLVECPVESVREKDVCVRTHRVEPFVECPEGFILTQNSLQCRRRVPLPNIFYCPPNTVRHGETCLKKVPVAANLVCPKGYTLSNNHCTTVKTFDCSEQRNEKQTQNEDYKHHGNKPESRFLRELYTKKSHFQAVQKPASTDEIYEVQRLCKRVHTEAAEKVCPKGAEQDGKECFILEDVPFAQKSGGFKEDVTPAKIFCPEGSVQSSKPGSFHCLVKELTPPRVLCPENTEDLGKTCARFRPFVLQCANGYTLKGDVCVRTMFSPPIVEFSLKFKCHGKGCEHHLPTASEHG